jgi:glycosyltransferase involved in cell wall biosynthesis
MTSAGAPLVSVIIPSWNRRDLLAECLRGLFAQTWEPFEVIVVDNGSTDGSADMVAAEWGARARLVRNARNEGYARAVNQGIHASRGAYVATLNNEACPIRAGSRRW